MKKTLLFLFCAAACIALSGMLTISAAPAPVPQPLKIGVLPDLDSLPIILAAKEGLFAAQGVEVELVNFRNPVERDAAFQAGRLDGIVADILGAVFTVAGGGEGVIASVTSGRYGLAAAPASGIKSVKELAGKEIGISSNTVIEYVAATLLSVAGLPATSFKGLAVPQMPVRMELLLNGKLAAACLPEPLYALAVSQGAIPLGDSSSIPGAPGVLLFTRAAAKKKGQQLVLFFKAYRTACEKINANPDSYRTFLSENLGFPATITGSFKFVTYEMPRLPREDEITLVTSWMAQKGLVKRIPAYTDLCAENVMWALGK